MLLVIDIGNTNTNIGIYDNNQLCHNWIIASDIIKTYDEYGVIILSLLNSKNLKDKVKNSIISSVVPSLEETFSIAIQKYLNINSSIVSYKLKLPFKINIDNKKELGADRIANAAAAVNLYKLPVIVVDIGTATTFDIVDKYGFEGGIIAPGPYIQAKSLNKFTAKLPNLRIEGAKNAIGKNTIDAMLSGIVAGHRCMIEGMIEKCEKELDARATIVATGGFSDILFEGMKRPFDYIDKYLTLYGLKILYELNKEQI